MSLSWIGLTQTDATQDVHPDADDRVGVLLFLLNAVPAYRVD